ncbi:MAG: cytochrome d ubiquinol oxidase subunit II [Bacteroidales bacterium]|nr:cytochrome d ubiquinol oxidase subunit II [Bacteroidales bacterium]
MFTYSFLQHYWWFLISLIAGIFAFLLFVQGGQSMLFSLSKTADEKKLLINVLGRKWHYTFTTLVVFGGAFFASFPLFYSTSFGGAYWVWMAILFCFTLQAVSYEFQSQPGNVYGKNTYKAFLFINGVLGTFLVGVALATFFTGSEFTMNKGNIAGVGSVGPIISQWQNPWHGLEALLNLRNLALGLTVLFLARTMAILYFINRLDHAVLQKRSHKYLLYNAIPFVVFFLVFVIWTFLSEGFAVNPETNEVYMESMKYLNNFLQMPLLFVIFLVGVVLVLYGIIISLLKPKYRKGVWFAGPGAVLTVTMLIFVTGVNNTAFYPSVSDLQSSLTLQNASSSEFTLNAMAWVSLFIPIVMGYIFYAWRALEKTHTSIEEVKENKAY